MKYVVEMKIAGRGFEDAMWHEIGIYDSFDLAAEEVERNCEEDRRIGAEDLYEYRTRGVL